VPACVRHGVQQGAHHVIVAWLTYVGRTQTHGVGPEFVVCQPVGADDAEAGKLAMQTVNFVRSRGFQIRKASAWRAAKSSRDAVESPMQVSTGAPTVKTLVEQYRIEKMPKRYSTRSSYEAWLRNHKVPRFGQCAILDVQARPAELWLQSLSLTPRSRAAVHGLLRILWDFAMWSGSVRTQRNPMELSRSGAHQSERASRVASRWMSFKDSFITWGNHCRFRQLTRCCGYLPTISSVISLTIWAAAWPGCDLNRATRSSWHLREELPLKGCSLPTSLHVSPSLAPHFGHRTIRHFFFRGGIRTFSHDLPNWSNPPLLHVLHETVKLGQATGVGIAAEMRGD